MRTKKYIILLIAFLFAGISMGATAQNNEVTKVDTTVAISTTVVTAPQVENVVSSSGSSYIMESLNKFLQSTGFALMDWKYALMIFIACLLLYLAIVKQFEPLLLLPIAFGMLLSNMPGAGMFTPEIFAG
jgi:oxaloacetate decarboxylase beta subunit